MERFCLLMEDFFLRFVGMTREGKKVKSEDMYYKQKCRPNCHF